jgi:hypothetical protein
MGKHVCQNLSNCTLSNVCSVLYRPVRSVKENKNNLKYILNKKENNGHVTFH